MAKIGADPPTKSELAILKVLWRQGRSSAREVHDVLGERQDWAISTTRTLVERMHAKGLLHREDYHGVAVYRAAVEKVATIGAVLKDFAASVFDVHGDLPVSAFASSDLLTKDELDQLSALLNATAPRDAPPDAPPEPES